MNTNCQSVIPSTVTKPVRSQLIRSGSLVVLLWAGIVGPTQAIEVTIPLPGFAADNYAECVLDQIGHDIGPVHIQALESDCRSRFPKPSKRGLFGPASVQSCYRKNEHRINHQRAAKAVYGACQDYFRDRPADQTALRGSRLK